MPQPPNWRERAAAIRWARELTADPRTLYLDTETTGIDDGAEVVDIAITDNRGRVLLDTLVRPRIPIPADATRVHGITDWHVRHAPDWESVYPKVAALVCRARAVVIYNAEFDCRVLDYVCRRAGLASLRADWHCAMLRYADYAGVWNHKYGNWKWHRLVEAASSFGCSLNGVHRALADAQLCRAVVFGMAGRSE